MIGPVLVSILIARRSEVKLSSILCVIWCFIAIAVPSEGDCCVFF